MTGDGVGGLLAAYAVADNIGTIMIAPKSGIGVLIIRLILFAPFPKVYLRHGLPPHGVPSVLAFRICRPTVVVLI